MPTESPFKGEDSGILLMRVSDMNSVGNELFINSTVSWSDDDSFMKRNFVAPAGSTILPKRGASISTNKKRLAVRPTYLDPNLMGVLPDSTVLKGVCMYYWFKTFDLNSITSGSSVPQLNKKI